MKQDFLKNRYNPKNSTIKYSSQDEEIRINFILDNLNLQNNDNVLDIGCYYGYIGNKIKNKYGVNVYGVDSCTEALEIAKSWIVTFEEDIENSKFEYFEENFFDAIILGEIIEHIYDLDNFLFKIIRILKDGGTIVITTPNFLSLGRRLNYLFGNPIFMEASLTYPKEAAGHIRYFTYNLLRRYLAQYNIIIEKYSSDVVNFGFGITSTFLAKLIPSFGREILLKCIIKKQYGD